MSKEQNKNEALEKFLSKQTPFGLEGSSRTSNPLNKLINKYYKSGAASSRLLYINGILSSFGSQDEDKIVTDDFVKLSDQQKNVIRIIANQALNFKNDRMSVSQVSEILKMQMIDNMLATTKTPVNAFIDLSDPNMSDLDASKIASALNAFASWSYVENLKADFMNQTMQDALTMLGMTYGKSKKGFGTILTLLEFASAFFEVMDTIRILTDHANPDILNEESVAVPYDYTNPFEGEQDDITASDLQEMKTSIFNHVSKLDGVKAINPTAVKAILDNSTVNEIKDMNNICKQLDIVSSPSHFKNIAPIMSNMTAKTAIDKNPNNQLLMLYMSSVGCKIKKVESSPKGILSIYKSFIKKPIEVKTFDISLSDLLKLDLDIFHGKKFTLSNAIVNKDSMMMQFSNNFLTHVRGLSKLNRQALVKASGGKKVSLNNVMQFLKDNGFREPDNDNVKATLYQNIANWANKQ